MPLVRALSETSALLCGGTAGIGLATARALAAAGVPRLMLVGRSAERGEASARELQRQYPAATVAFASADVTTCDGAMTAAAAARDAFGTVDLLVNTGGYGGPSGVGMPQPFAQMPIEEVAVASQGLLNGVLLPSHAVLPLMIAQTGGCIINVASDAGKVPTPGETVVGAGMAAIMMFSRALALEGKRSGVRVNCITPSIVRGTPLYDSLMAHKFASKLFTKAEAMAQLGVVDAADVAQLGVFLAAPAAAKISGQCISMNGGISFA